MSRNQVRVNIERPDPVAGGMTFGETGPYEWPRGAVHYAIDPDEPGLPAIRDLDLAPRNAGGLVEFSSTIDIVRPVDLRRDNRRILYEFSIRGTRGLITGFNYGRGADWTEREQHRWRARP